MPYSYFDITPAEVEFLKLLAQSGAVTGASLEQKLATVYNGKNFSLPIAEIEIDTGELTLPRLGAMMIVKVNTEGSASTDTVTSLSALQSGTWKDGDIIFFVAEIASRVVTFTDGNNIDLLGAVGSTCTISEPGHYLAMIYNSDGEMWTEIFRSPQSAYVAASAIGFEQDTLTIDAGAVTSSKSYLKIQSERSGEVLAEIDVQITAAGTDALFTLYIDEGAGQFALCEVQFSGTPLITAIIAAIAAAVIASGTGYTAVDDGVDTVTVSAPAGTGATPNATWTSEATGTGGMTFTASTDTFAGGVDGADADDDLDTINGLQSEMILWIENVMTAKTITLIDGGGTFSFGADVPLAAGEIGMMIVRDSVVKRFWCCKKKYAKTIWVDPNGNDTTAQVGLFNYPFKTIGAAVAATTGFDVEEIIIHSTGSSLAYDERNLMTVSDLWYTFRNGVRLSYSGAVDGGIFDDGGAGIVANFKFGNGAVSVQDLSTLYPLIENWGSAGTNRCIFKITAGCVITVYGGRFYAQDRCLSMAAGYIEFNNSHFAGAENNEVIKVTGGTAVFKNCTFENSGDNTINIVNITGGKIILENCRIHNKNNTATSHGITCSGGTVVLVGVNRIITTHAASQSINCTVNTTAKLIGELWTTHAIGGAGVITDSITAAPLALTVQNANVE